jgi:hypothetical protein
MIRHNISRRPRAALVLALAAGLSIAANAPAMAQDDTENDPPAEESEKPEKKSKRAIEGEKRLARMLEGREKGEPQNCIRAMPTEQMMTIDKTAYVYGRGNTIYVQRTTRPDQIDDRDTLVIQRFGGGSQLCRQDLATTIDPLTRIFTGAVMFEDFIPYTRVENDDNG